MFRKQSRVHFLLSQRDERERVSDQCFISFLRQNTDHGGGHGKSMSRRNGVAEEEPFPSQLRLHFLCEEEVPCWACSDLILGYEAFPSLASRRALNQQQWKANGGVRRAHTHTHACPDYWSGKHTHPHSRPNRKQCCLEQTSTSCVYWGLFAERAQSKSIMSCPLHHYHHHSRDITAHLLIATRPYLCLQPPANPKHLQQPPH